ncbi:unnamed protein product, partial [Allacma fusca]
SQVRGKIWAFAESSEPSIESVEASVSMDLPQASQVIGEESIPEA